MAVKTGLEHAVSEGSRYALVVQHDRAFCRRVSARTMQQLYSHLSSTPTARYIGFPSGTSKLLPAKMRDVYKLQPLLDARSHELQAGRLWLRPSIFWYDSNHLVDAARALEIYEPYVNAPQGLEERVGGGVGVNRFRLRRGDFIEERFGVEQRNLLASLRDEPDECARFFDWFELYGRVVLLFQPAEERHPANNPMGGAIRMIRDLAAGRALATRLGVTNAAKAARREAAAPTQEEAAISERERNETDGFDCSMDGALLDGVDEVYGAHLWNYASAGTVGCTGGSVTANSDSLTLIVRGTGGHASAPQGTVDAVVVAAQLISALQMLVSRNVSPTESAVLTLGKIEGGFAPNVIATEVRIGGTIRTFTAPVKALLVKRIHQVSAGIAASHGPRCSIDVQLKDGYPACVNDERCAESVLAAARGLLPARLVGPPTPNMAGEDFTFFLARKPGAFFFVGSNPHAPCVMDDALPTEAAEGEHGSRKVVAHHTPEFDIHEGALAVGAATWAALALHRLVPPPA